MAKGFLAKKILPPSMRNLVRPQRPLASPPPPPGNLARKLQPPGPLGKFYTDPELQTGEERLSFTKEIAARQTTGIARRRVQSDVSLPYNMIPLDSSRVADAGYREDTQIIRVHFVDGTPWEYYNVPPQVWHQFQKSASPGRFINATLNEYPYGQGRF